LNDENFLKVGELCDPNTIFNLLLKKSATSEHNANLTPHILMFDSQLCMAWVFWQLSCKTTTHPLKWMENGWWKICL